MSEKEGSDSLIRAICDLALKQRDLAEAEIQHLKTLIGELKWKSVDKDNMEFECRTTCFIVDKLHKALTDDYHNELVKGLKPENEHD